MRELPFAIDNAERDVLVWRPSGEPQQDRVVVSGLANNFVGRCDGFVDEVGVEDIEFVTLHDLGRGVVRAT